MGEGRIGILAIAGPTASGKSALAVRVARRLGGEIVSCDSMQVYRGMDVGTAKPSEEEMDGVPHHMLDVASPALPFSAAEYVEGASRAIADIAARGHVPVICGGTGLYLDALLRGGFSETQSDPDLRASLLAFAEAHGAHALHARLRAVDPESAEAIHENNVKRVVRALEIYESTGMTKTETDLRSREMPSPYDATVLCLHYPTREILYERIARRVNQMLVGGLVEETRRLDAEGVFLTNSTAAQAIGYKELLPFIRGEEPLEAGRERLILATRHYAKRQMTWFGAKAYVQSIEMDCGGVIRPLDEVADEVLGLWSRRGGL